VADPVIPVVPDDETLRRILAEARTIAVVGLSSKPGRASLDIGHSLQERGYRIIPVNPRETEVLGETAYPSLRDIPEEIHVDIVDVFRRAEDTPEVARDAVAIGAKALWLQLDIVSEEAGAIASAGGLDVIMGVCIKQTAQRLDRDEEREGRNDG
jgi:predicted CoA-binding protein